MKAIIQDYYGPPQEVLRVADIEIPALGEDDVLVRVRAASVHADVWHVVAGRPYLARLMGPGVRKPKRPVPGTDLVGISHHLSEEPRFARMIN
jgi:NADPH:quinone reductase-like Zn-dependent oxidoreductase